MLESLNDDGVYPHAATPRRVRCEVTHVPHRSEGRRSGRGILGQEDHEILLPIIGVAHIGIMPSRTRAWANSYVAFRIFVGI